MQRSDGTIDKWDCAFYWNNNMESIMFLLPTSHSIFMFSLSNASFVSNSSGFGYIIKIIATEAFVLVPSWWVHGYWYILFEYFIVMSLSLLWILLLSIWSGVTYGKIEGKVSCNTRTELELVLLLICKFCKIEIRFITVSVYTFSSSSL